MFSQRIEMVVRPSKREDDLFDICDEDGVLLCVITKEKFTKSLKPIKHKEKYLYKFYRPDGNYFVYSVDKIIMSGYILKANEKKKNR